MKNCLLRSFQALLVFSLAFTLTNCGNLDNPLEELSGGGGSGGSSTINATDIKLDQTLKVFKLGDAALTITATVTPTDATDKSVTWESSDPTIATVENGVVTPKALGIAKITAKSGDLTATCEVFVGTEVDVSLGNPIQDYDILAGTQNSSSISIPDGYHVAFNGVNTDQGIVCSGDATIYLIDGKTNTVTAPSTKAGIQIGGTGTELTINAETEGTGTLDVTGKGGGAGIGTVYVSNASVTRGNIVINGGKITATGGSQAAGIGTGLSNSGASAASNQCGDITINGGTVTATGSDKAAGIGTGLSYVGDASACSNTCGAITINGGTVIATGGNDAAGIGTGLSHVGGTGAASQTCGAITIAAGVKSVTATKGTQNESESVYNSIGIGGTKGGSSTQNPITIKIGGEVKAQSEFTGATYTYEP